MEEALGSYMSGRGSCMRGRDSTSMEDAFSCEEVLDEKLIIL
jgi:hypothetical protein